MKISNRNFFILFFFVVSIFLQTVSFSSYRTVVMAEKQEKKIIESKIVVEQAVSLSCDEQQVLDLINEYRVQNGLSELKPLSILQNVAKIKAYDLVNNNYFAHVSPSLGSPFQMLQDYGVDYFSIEGENLAGTVSGPRAVAGWIKSTPHRENILETRYEYTGIAIVDSSVYGKVFVQLFIGV